MIDFANTGTFIVSLEFYIHLKKNIHDPKSEPKVTKPLAFVPHEQGALYIMKKFKAETLKGYYNKRMQSTDPLEEELTMEVRGRDLVAGLPKTITISSEEKEL